MNINLFFVVVRQKQKFTVGWSIRDDDVLLIRLYFSVELRNEFHFFFHHEIEFHSLQEIAKAVISWNRECPALLFLEISCNLFKNKKRENFYMLKDQVRFLFIYRNCDRFIICWRNIDFNPLECAFIW